MKHDAALADAECTEGEARGIRTVQDVAELDHRELAACPIDQCTPPARTGEKRRSGGRKQSHCLSK